MEKWIKVLHSQPWVLPQTQAPGDLRVIWVSITVINIALLNLPLDSDPKLPVGQWISCNYSCTISSLMKILFVKLKYLYIQYAWISVMKKQNINQNVKVEKMVVLVRTFDHYHHKFQIFQLSCTIVKEFETIQF